jgi:hypothetical protein
MDALMIRRYFGDGTFRTIPEQDAEAVVPSAARLETTHDMPGGFARVGAVDPATEQLEALRDDLGFHDLMACSSPWNGHDRGFPHWMSPGCSTPRHRPCEGMRSGPSLPSSRR